MSKKSTQRKAIKIWHLEESMEFLKQLEKLNHELFLKLWKNFKKAEMLNNGLGGDCFGKLQEDIWYFRENDNGIWYRSLCFWDKTGSENTLVVCTHTFLKKGNKIPQTEINKAKNMRKLYFIQKEDG